MRALLIHGAMQTLHPSAVFTFSFRTELICKQGRSREISGNKTGIEQGKSFGGTKPLILTFYPARAAPTLSNIDSLAVPSFLGAFRIDQPTV